MEDSNSFLNVCVVAGTVKSLPEERTLNNGDRVTTFDVKVGKESGTADRIRVSWVNAPASALDIRENTEVLVRGRIRSYWANRTVIDMECTSVVPWRSAKRVRTSLEAVIGDIEAACP